MGPHFVSCAYNFALMWSTHQRTRNKNCLKACIRDDGVALLTQLLANHYRYSMVVQYGVSVLSSLVDGSVTVPREVLFAHGIMPVLHKIVAECSSQVQGVDCALHVFKLMQVRPPLVICDDLPCLLTLACCALSLRHTIGNWRKLYEAYHDSE
jgi:hypothetical protein